MRRSRLTWLVATFLALPALGAGSGPPLPWQGAGLTARQAAAHLLDRFAFGAGPGEIDRVLATGLEAWLEGQLRGDLDESDLAPRLAPFESLGLTTRQIAERYPNPGLLLNKMRREGLLGEEPGADASPESADRDALRAALRAYGRQEGYRSQRELIGELYAQKLLRAVYSENRLHEVLVDFWFNHFNVSITDNDLRPYVTSYERDAIRPHVTGPFRDLLEATAKHPAMLLYLDNARSVADADAATTFDLRQARARFGRGGGAPRRARADRARVDRRPRGLNENYARELLELHTLGVDGGYDQADVIAVARAFTGWTLEPPRLLLDDRGARRLAGARRLPPAAGFVFEGSFLFRADVHDAGAKTVLGTRLPAGRGIEDGEAVLDLLAAHPSTARHVARKLAVRFVSDAPPDALVAAMAATFQRTGGDLTAVLRTLAWSPAFWAPSARHRKIKSPFELAVSALRALDADVRRPRGVLEWVRRMGQPLYAYQAPTGFPDRSEAWVNTGSLLTRMSFGLQLAGGQIAGVHIDLSALDGGREPESLSDALRTYLPLLLPGREPERAFARLEPVIRDPDLARKLAAEAPVQTSDAGFALDDLDLGWELESAARAPRGRQGRPGREPQPPSTGRLGHVVGVILGSPEFQRR